MNVLIISSSSAETSGIVAFNLNENLNTFGHNSRLLTLFDNSGLKNVINYHNSVSWFLTSYYGRVGNKLKRTFLKGDEVKRNPRYHILDMREDKIRFPSTDILKKIPFTPDVIIALFTHQFVNTENLYDLSFRFNAPVLWYLMDMGPMTGGCHYAWDCIGYINSCGTCPGLYSLEKEDFSHDNLLFKQRFVERMHVIVISASEWLDRQVRRSALFREKPLYKILLSCDPEIFKPTDKEAVRKVLNIPLDKRIIFFGSVRLNVERKGMACLIEALNILRQRLTDTPLSNSVHCLVAGEKSESLFREMALPFTYVGTLKNEQELSLAYQAADLFVCPSIEDSGPSMINQAIMTGTPVVAFNMGVAPDLVHTGFTGYRAELKDCADLANGICSIIDLPMPAHHFMSQSCRKLGIEQCHPDKQAQQFNAIIETIKYAPVVHS